MLLDPFYPIHPDVADARPRTSHRHGDPSPDKILIAAKDFFYACAHAAPAGFVSGRLFTSPPGDQGPVYCKPAGEPPIIKTETMGPERADAEECSAPGRRSLSPRS